MFLYIYKNPKTLLVSILNYIFCLRNSIWTFKPNYIWNLHYCHTQYCCHVELSNVPRINAFMSGKHTGPFLLDKWAADEVMSVQTPLYVCVYVWTELWYSTPANRCVCEWESEPPDKHYHSYLSVRMETVKQQSSQTQTHVHTRTRSPRFWQTWVMPPTLSLVTTSIHYSQGLNEHFEVI